MRELPVGVVTFLFTDVEGSTRLWEQSPATMREALVRHDALIENLTEANQGTLVRPRGEGDSRFAVFAQASSAVATAGAIQEALSAETWPTPHPLRVRMALHTGEADLRDGDYYGSAVNRCARLRSLAHGSQTLLSRATTELVRDNVPARARLDDLGEHRLKDMVRPEHVYQLTLIDSLDSFPTLQSLDSFPNNLPIQLTSFIGREREIAEAKNLLSTERLLTFTGSGGTGKSRLSMQVAAEVLPDFRDGAWLVELAALTDPALVLPSIATTFDVRPLPGVPLESAVIDYLRARHLLLMLDNCEHLLEACATLADTLLHSCPHLKILASSREGLGIAGETVYRIPSLSLPDTDEPDVNDILSSEAAQLFMARAAATSARFMLTTRNAPALAQICHRLDGIPLALELAAARVTMFSAEQIAARLGDRFRLLTGGSRTALPRQQTLRAMIDWSYDLLTPPERALLQRLSVFVGGWTFEAAEAMTDELDVLELLTQLVNKSLVIVDEQDGVARYRLLETIRQYARDRLFESGDSPAAWDRHLDYFLHFTEEVGSKLSTAEFFTWIERIEHDYDNILAALEWGAENRLEDTLLLVGNLNGFWSNRSHDKVYARLQGIFDQLNARPADSEANSRRRETVRPKGLLALGTLALQQSDFPPARAAFSEAVAAARLIGDKSVQAYALIMWSVVLSFINDYVGIKAAAQESVAFFRETGENWGLAVALYQLGMAEGLLGDPVAQQARRDEAKQLVIEFNHPMTGYAMFGMGISARNMGNFGDARHHFQLALNALNAVRNTFFPVMIESELGHLSRIMGEMAEAKAIYQRTLPIFADRGNRDAIAHQLECFAFIAHVEGQPERSVKLLSAAAVLRAASASVRAPWEQVEFEQEIGALRTALGEETFNTLWTAGRTFSMDTAVALALSP